ncbi:MAG: Na+:H+ antiporter, NhaA family [Actinomycetota bacterium]|nr:Na+:H+ antiporter, NhaA family [Actinomycetota bacterium]
MCREVWSASEFDATRRSLPLPLSPDPDPDRPPPSLGRFLRTEAAGGVALLLATAAALAWANSRWGDGYVTAWRTAVRLEVGSVGFDGDLRHLVNDGLMALFFFVVGLEIKRELVAGELRAWRTAALPAIGAVGGMVVPALVYLAVNAGGVGARGWGVPMATDIAFAVGVVALLGRRVPSSLKLFLLTLAIVDDLGAIVVIAVFYAGGISFPALLVAGLLLAAMAGLRRAGVAWLPAYVLLGAGVWLAVYESGMHATIAGAVLGLLAPLAVAERLEDRLHPLTSFAIVPLFALANAGIVLTADALDGPGATRIALGAGLGLVVGKLVGVSGAAWLAVRLGIGDLPEGVGWGQMVGIAAMAGIGFTVSLFVAGLAFTTPGAEDAAKIGVLAASAVASVVGVSVLLGASSRDQWPDDHPVDTLPG